MSKYTTEVRYICEINAGLKSSVGADEVDTVIANSREKIFNFDFPIFDESYRPNLETKILKHFYTREIGFETVGLWKLKLNTKLNEIMPYYNKLYDSELLEFNPLYTTDIRREHNENATHKGDITDNGGGSNTTNYNSTSLNKYSDTPQGTVENLENGTYLTNASQDSRGGFDTSNINRQNTNTRDLTDTTYYLDTVVGYEGVDANERLAKYRKNLLNIDMMIIRELEELFLQLW